MFRSNTHAGFQLVSLGELGRCMCEGEYESLRAINEVSPGFVPTPYAGGKLEQGAPGTYFLLTEFREIREQVSDAHLLAAVFQAALTGTCRNIGNFNFGVSQSRGRGSFKKSLDCRC